MGPKTRAGKVRRISVRREAEVLAPPAVHTDAVASPRVDTEAVASPSVASPGIPSSSVGEAQPVVASLGTAPPSVTSPTAAQDSDSTQRQCPPPPLPETYLGEASTSFPDIETDAVQPELYFPHTHFAKACRIASKCEEYIKIGELNTMLHPEEKRWFVEHPQFSHLWHKPSEKNHKLQGVWLLLLRTAKIEEDNVFWFVVNGVPIRYSLMEHGLISGLSCVAYSEGLTSMGSLDFFRKHWGYRKARITVKDVVEKIEKMGKPRRFNNERLKMANLLFLSTVIGEKKKYGVVDEFFIRVAGDLELCRTFPWGRWTFDDVSKEIKRTMNVFQGEWKSSWTIPGFIIPLEVM